MPDCCQSRVEASGLGSYDLNFSENHPIRLFLEYLLNRCPPVYIEMIRKLVKKFGRDAIACGDWPPAWVPALA